MAKLAFEGGLPSLPRPESRRTLRQLASSETDDLVTLLIDGASLQVQARIELLDRAEQLSLPEPAPRPVRPDTKRRADTKRRPEQAA